MRYVSLRSRDLIWVLVTVDSIKNMLNLCVYECIEYSTLEIVTKISQEMVCEAYEVFLRGFNVTVLPVYTNGDSYDLFLNKLYSTLEYVSCYNTDILSCDEF